MLRRVLEQGHAHGPENGNREPASGHCVQASMRPARVYIGWDPRQEDAYRVCSGSILRRGKAEVFPLVQGDLRASGLYSRPVDALAATEFSLTRFLTPHLAQRGFALFVDCDFLFLTDINRVFDEVDPSKALSVVKHDYTPREATKMDGRPQYLYPRKNWSSFMVFNCDHPKVQALTPDVVNRATPGYLHQAQWLSDDDIGGLDIGWNYLEGWYPPGYRNIHAIHYTRGGPWFEDYRNCDFAEEWIDEWNHLK
jgi:hypothetical protein